MIILYDYEHLFFKKIQKYFWNSWLNNTHFSNILAVMSPELPI